jgi:branched-chain amino acid transport system substrate-binding protein
MEQVLHTILCQETQKEGKIVHKLISLRSMEVLIAALVLLQPELTYSQKAPQIPAQIVMGGPISLSGPYAKEGSQGLWGFQVAEKWINDVNGGIRIDGKKIPVKYVYYDDESKKESVTSLLERLIVTDGVKFTFAPYSSGLTLAGAPVTEKYKALYNSHGGASDRTFEQGYRYAVQTIVPGSRYHVDVFDMIKRLDPKAINFAMLYEDDEFSRSVREGALQYSKKLGYKVVFDRTYPSKVQDMTPALTELAAARADFLLGGGHFPDGQLLARQMTDLGVDFRAASILVSPTLPEFYNALRTAAEGIIGPAHWEIGVKFSPETTPKGTKWFGPTQKEFLDSFRKISKGVDPDYHGVEATAALLSYALGIEAAKSLDTDKVRQAMGNLRFVSVYGDWGIDPETGRQVVHKSVLIQWQKGQKEIVWPAEAQTAKACYPMPSSQNRLAGKTCQPGAGGAN